MDLPGHSGGEPGGGGYGDRRQRAGQNPHHSCARHWLQSDLNVDEVSAWLGDSSLTVTCNTYLVLAPETLGDISEVP